MTEISADLETKYHYVQGLIPRHGDSATLQITRQLEKSVRDKSRY